MFNPVNRKGQPMWPKMTPQTLSDKVGEASTAVFATTAMVAVVQGVRGRPLTPFFWKVTAGSGALFVFKPLYTWYPPHK